MYLAPKALREIMQMISWSGFGLKDHRTKRTSLLKMIEADATLHESVTITENTRLGVAPRFQSAGFIKPDTVTLIENGRYRDCLVSPRSSKEYGVRVNAGAEYPQSLDMAAGELADEEALQQLDTGVYVNTLWYLNYSDRPACRITGMTRFATFWVEHGRIVAPLSVMRFDEKPASPEPSPGRVNDHLRGPVHRFRSPARRADRPLPIHAVAVRRQHDCFNGLLAFWRSRTSTPHKLLAADATCRGRARP